MQSTAAKTSSRTTPDGSASKGTQPLKIVLGRETAPPHKEVILNTAEIQNGHILVVGSSGVGKTTFLKRILGEMKVQSDIRLHVFDVHGDIDSEATATRTVTFSETSDFGVSALDLSSDPHYGGVRKKINSFIGMLNRYGGKLGQRQQALLRALLYELYESRGFLRREPATWKANGRRFPTMCDLRDFTMTKLTKSSFPHCEQALDILHDLSRKMTKVRRAATEGNTSALAKLSEDALESFANVLCNLTTGEELASVVRYDNPEILRSLYDRIDCLEQSGIFKPRPPFFERSKPIWRYNIKALSDEEQCYLIELYLFKVFLRDKERGIAPGGGLRTWAIIDEAQKLISEEPDHIINIIVREARKFGMGICFASQSHRHFTADIISNCATKVVLGCDAVDRLDLARKFGIPEQAIASIRPRKTGLIQIKKSGDLNNTFTEVSLFPR